MNSDVGYLTNVLLFPLALSTRFVEGATRSWEEHPDYKKVGSIPVELVLESPNGVRAYVYCSVDSIEEATKWGVGKTDMERVAIAPLPYHIPHSVRFALVKPENASDAKSLAYHARMTLKALLPPNLKKYVKYVRSRNGYTRTKWHFLSMSLPMLNHAAIHHSEAHAIAQESPPEWYKAHTIFQLNVIAFETFHPEVAARIRYWMGSQGVTNFYRVVKGKVHPNDVEALFIRQYVKRGDKPQQLTLL